MKHVLYTMACGLALTCVATAADDTAGGARGATGGGTSGATGGSGHAAAGHDAKIAQLLALGNHEEIELANLAKGKASHEKVKQFADHMIQDHTKMLQQLHQFGARPVGQGHSSSAGHTGSAGGSATIGQSDASVGGSGSASGGTSGGGRSQGGSSGQGAGGSGSGSAGASRSAGSGTSGSGGSGSGGSGSAGASGSGSAGASGQGASGLGNAGRSGAQGSATSGSAASGSGAHGAASAHGHMASAHGSDLMSSIKEQACMRKLQMTKEDFQKKEGAEFDKAYVTQQVVAHVEMLATLQTVRSHVSSQFQQVVDQGIQTTQEHLDHAKSLAKELDGQQAGRGASNQ